MEEIDGDGTRTEEEEIAIQEKAQECDSIKYVYTKDDTGSYKIVKGSYILLGVSVYYISSESQPLADGEFSIQFSDLKFNFTTNNPHPTE